MNYMDDFLELLAMSPHEKYTLIMFGVFFVVITTILIMGSSKRI